MLFPTTVNACLQWFRAPVHSFTDYKTAKPVSVGLVPQQPGHSQCHRGVNVTGSVPALRDPCKGTSKQGWDNSSTKQKHSKATLYNGMVPHRIVQRHKKFPLQTVSLLKCHCLSSSLHKWGSTVNYYIKFPQLIWLQERVSIQVPAPEWVSPGAVVA